MEREFKCVLMQAMENRWGIRFRNGTSYMNNKFKMCSSFHLKIYGDSMVDFNNKNNNRKMNIIQSEIHLQMHLHGITIGSKNMLEVLGAHLLALWRELIHTQIIKNPPRTDWTGLCMPLSSNARKTVIMQNNPKSNFNSPLFCEWWNCETQNVNV